MRLLLDTHVLIWVPTGDPRVSAAARQAIQRADAELCVSAVTAFELADLQARGRIAMTEPIATITGVLGLTLVDLPADLWAMAAKLPMAHGDPIDRMLVAHAIAGDFALLTADANIRRYPVRVIW